MKLVIVRRKSTKFGVSGDATLINDSGSDVFYTCKTLEMPWHNNDRGLSCIIADTYKAQIYNSPHFGHEVYRLEDKHGRQACEIHNGNFAGDPSQDLETQVHGCTLVGSDFAQVTRSDRKELQWGIINSRQTLRELITCASRQDLEVTYQWGDGCDPTDL